MNFKNTLILFLLGITFSCQKTYLEKENPKPTVSANKISSALTSQAILTENFETGAKTAYTTGDVVLSSGTWTFTDALIGNSASDAKTGSQSARVRNGKLAMKFDKTTGAGTISIAHARYGADVSGNWQLWVSTNSGATYVQNGATITSSSNLLSTVTFTVNLSGNIRIEIRKTDGGTNRINFDDVSISDYSGTNPAPTLASISPNSAIAGGSGFTLTVTGSNFISSSQILWNTTALTTVYTSPTQLSATVASALIASTGTASITVLSPTPGGGTSSGQTFTINAATTTSKKFLFDNTKAETAGNADWVIDQDNSVPGRYPTPAQSGITSTTSETFWLGAISSWGIALVKKGHTVETLPTTGSITYGNATNAQDLSNYHVFVIDEPNKVFSAAEKTALLQFVKNGGGLCMISDHNISDRNNDGWDSPAILNDFFTNNSVQSNPFGWSVDLNNFSGVSSNVSSTSSPVLSGLGGVVSNVQYNNGASLTLNTTANSSVAGLVWKSGTTKNSSNVLCATSTFGSGRAFILGDSSPTDDGTGASGNVLYNGWSAYSHAALLVNASLWLAKVQ